MGPAKKLAAQFYYHGTLGYRWWRWRRACTARQAPIGILVFHRVANDRANRWTTSNSTFTRAIRWLRENVELVSLAEVQQRVSSGRNDRARMSITFDDGYAENCQHAMPLLIEQKIPCTYFVSVNPVLKGVPFEHDVVNGQRLAPNTICQLRSLSDCGVEIGAHTRTHADLGQITCRAPLLDEIVYARDDLQEALGRRSSIFRFPIRKTRQSVHDVVSVVAHCWV